LPLVAEQVAKMATVETVDQVVVQVVFLPTQVRADRVLWDKVTQVATNLEVVAMVAVVVLPLQALVAAPAAEAM
jgi:hypothetical protein